MEDYVDAVVVTLLTTEHQLQEYRDAQKQDKNMFSLDAVLSEQVAKETVHDSESMCSESMKAIKV